MSDFLRKFKSIFIVEDPNAAAGGAGKEAQPPQQQPAQTAATPETKAVPLVKGSMSDKFVDILSNALEQNNQQGYDYFEFRQTLANLSSMGMDERTRFQSAFASAKTMGVTPQHLTASLQFYLKVLGGEQAKFNEAHAQQRAKLIGNREEEIRNLESAIQQKTQQIADLTRQIEEHRQQSEQIRAAISENTLKIETTKADFDATYQSIYEQLAADGEKIKQYL